MDTVFKALSERERKTYAKLKAEVQAKQPAVPAAQLADVIPATRRTHRVQRRHGARADDTVPESDSLAFCVEEAARLIGVSRATLYVVISAGDLRTVKIRKRRLVPRDALLELLATGGKEA
jgi:excisionase family DNA binding protein